MGGNNNFSRFQTYIAVFDTKKILAEGVENKANYPSTKRMIEMTFPNFGYSTSRQNGKEKKITSALQS